MLSFPDQAAALKQIKDRYIDGLSCYDDILNNGEEYKNAYYLPDTKSKDISKTKFAKYIEENINEIDASEFNGFGNLINSLNQIISEK